MKTAGSISASSATSDLHQCQTVLHEIGNKFLPAIFGEDIDDTIRGITSLPTKFAGAGIPNPVTNSSVNYETSTLAVSHLSQAIQGKSDFNLLDHENVRRSTRNAYITKRNDSNEIALSHHLDTLRKDGKEQLCRTINRGRDTGIWLSTIPSALNGNLLGHQEFQDAFQG